MTEQEVLELLNEIGAVITGSHIVYTSGRHGEAYVNKDAIYPHTKVISRLCLVMAEPFTKDGVQAVIAPAVGGVILAQWVAYHLTNLTGEEVLGLYADKSDDGFTIKRGYDKLVTGKKVLVVEDVLTTGGSVRKVIEAVRDHGGQVVGLGAICNRGGVTAADVGGVPKLEALVNVALQSWEKDACPLCQKGVPINTDVGKGREFLHRIVP